MKHFELTAEPRNAVGKKHTKLLRKKGLIPCVMYGGKEVIHFSTDDLSLKNLIYTPNSYIVDLTVGDNNYKAVLKTIQFHPVTDKVEHIDFIECYSDKPVKISIPVKLTGICIGLKSGGKLIQRKRNLIVQGLIPHLPDSLDIDITACDIGSAILVRDLNFENIQIIESPNTPVLSIVSSRIIAKGMSEEAPKPVAVEGEETPAEGDAPAEETEKKEPDKTKNK